MKPSVTLLITLLIAAPASAQVKSWTDERGVTHFEAQGQAWAPSESGTASAKSAPPRSKTPIERASLGVALGDHVSTYVNATDWRIVERDDKTGLIIAGRLAKTLPPGVKNLAVVFVDGRAAKILTTYTELTLGGWQSALKNTSAKYGTPTGDLISSAIWFDSVTVLTVKKTYREEIEAYLGDITAMQRYADRSGQNVPKF